MCRSFASSPPIPRSALLAVCIATAAIGLPACKSAAPATLTTGSQQSNVQAPATDAARPTSAPNTNAALSDGPGRLAIDHEPATHLAAPASLPPSIWQEVPGAAYRFELRLVPGSADGAVKPFYIATTELTWEAADAYIYRMDEEKGQTPPGGPDAVTRPSKPYLPPDRGFGHEGFAAITMSFQNAQQFCAWLTTHESTKSKRKFRLPTEAEWQHAASGGKPQFQPENLADVAWFADNSNGAPQRVATKQPNAWGLHDMLGNVQEWCLAPDGTGVTRGGSYRDGPDKVNTSHREPNNRAWNASDPQIPKSKWWLADGPFVGFRVVCEVQ